MIAYRSRLAFWSGVVGVSIGAAPTALAALAALHYGVETRRRRLEDIAPA